MIRKIETGLSIMLTSLVVLGLLFRATLYWQLPVVPGESMGVADLIELLFFFLIISFAMLLLVMAVLLMIKRDYRQGARGAVLGMTAPVIYYLLHPLV